MRAPSSLPDWRQFNETLLDEAKNAALRVEGLEKEAKAAIRSLTLDDVGITAQSEAIVKIIAGDRYFPVLRLLNSERPNLNHAALAELASRGIVRAIVTTNFDTLIERAFAEAKTPLKIAIGAADFMKPPDPNVCTLYKIHGSVTDTTSLVDTIGQKMRGLPPYTRVRLAQLFNELHVLVLGYSGWDLEVGSDYLAFASVSDGAPGITWVEREASTPRRRLARLKSVVARAGSRGLFYQASLPGFFAQLGVSVDVEAANKTTKGSRKPDERVRTETALFFKNLGNRNALALCMRLLLDCGKLDEAMLLRASLISAVEAQDDQIPDEDGPVLRALAVTARLTEGTAGVRHWTLLELSHLEAKLRRWEAQSQEVKSALRTKKGRDLAQSKLPHPFHGSFDLQGWLGANRQVVNELQRLQAGALGNLAGELISEGDMPAASTATKRAMDFAELSASPIELASAYLIYAMGLLRASESPDSGLQWLIFAEAAGIISGNVDAANAAASLRAQCLISGGEYDGALQALTRVGSRLQLGVNRETEVEVQRIAGCISVRRGQIESAMEYWRGALETAKSAPPLSGRVLWTMIFHLSFVGPLRPALIQKCDELLNAMKNGKLPVDGRLQGIPPLEVVQKFQTHLRENAMPEEPFFLHDTPQSGDPGLRAEFALRHGLIKAEFFCHDLIIVEYLGKLLQHTYQAGAGERALELVEVLRVAAGKAAELVPQFQAEWYAGHVLHALGDVDGARRALEYLNEIQFAGDPGFNDRVSDKLARINSEPAPRLSTNLLMQRIVNGERALPETPQEFEAIAQGAVEGGELAPARILCVAAIAAYRLEHDNPSIARCFELLANAAGKEGRTAQAEALTAKARDLASPRA